MFWKPNDSIKNKSYVFSGYKQRSKMCLAYLQDELYQDRCGWWIYKLKSQKMEELRY